MYRRTLRFIPVTVFLTLIFAFLTTGCGGPNPPVAEGTDNLDAYVGRFAGTWASVDNTGVEEVGRLDISVNPAGIITGTCYNFTKGIAGTASGTVSYTGQTTITFTYSSTGDILTGMLLPDIDLSTTETKGLNASLTASGGDTTKTFVINTVKPVPSNELSGHYLGSWQSIDNNGVSLTGELDIVIGLDGAVSGTMSSGFVYGWVGKDGNSALLLTYPTNMNTVGTFVEQGPPNNIKEGVGGAFRRIVSGETVLTITINTDKE